jgi:hypothetical protein
VRLSGSEASSGERSAITCTALSKLPKIGEGLVIPKDNHFIDLNHEDGELKVPASISLQEPGGDKSYACGELYSVADSGSAHCDFAVGANLLRYDNAAVFNWRRYAYNSLLVYGWRHDRLRRDNRDIPGWDQSGPLITFAILQRHNRQRLLRHQSWPFITSNNAVLDHAALNHPVLDRWSDKSFLDRKLTPDWWAPRSRLLILEVWRQICRCSGHCTHQGRPAEQECGQTRLKNFV